MTTWDTPIKDEPKRRRGKKEICRCGHAESWHTVTVIGALCEGGRNTCDCSTWKPILKADDARDFTFGSGDNAVGHPLLMGVRKAITNERGVEWMTEDELPPRCDLWNCDGVSVAAVGVEGQTVFFCDEHRKDG